MLLNLPQSQLPAFVEAARDVYRDNNFTNPTSEVSVDSNAEVSVDPDAVTRDEADLEGPEDANETAQDPEHSSPSLIVPCRPQPLSHYDTSMDAGEPNFSSTPRPPPSSTSTPPHSSQDLILDTQHPESNLASAVAKYRQPPLRSSSTGDHISLQLLAIESMRKRDCLSRVFLLCRELNNLSVKTSQPDGCRFSFSMILTWNHLFTFLQQSKKATSWKLSITTISVQSWAY